MESQKINLPVPSKRQYNCPDDDGWVQGKHKQYHYGDPRLIERKETEKYEITTTEEDVYLETYTGEYEYIYTIKDISRNQLYPCIGGPLDGQKKSLNQKDYIAYNCASRPDGKKDKRPNSVQIHRSVLGV